MLTNKIIRNDTCKKKKDNLTNSILTDLMQMPKDSLIILSPSPDSIPFYMH